ncbi:MAG TPA: RNA methyltransferase [Peptococcaceae bacterium]|nr:MAG: tRNA/rRNA methyltransferase (SpoU) [Moorella sp. 60_41]HBT47206.1 RNA methyltransferase [Peptococcaceae bacterium]
MSEPVGNIITSRANRYVKLARSLYRRAQREKTGLYLLEGEHLIVDALAARAEVEVVFYDTNFLRVPEHARLVSQLREAGYLCLEVQPAVMQSMAATVTPPGALAIARQKKVSLSQLLENQEVFLLVADGVQDPGNLGTMLRTAVAAGCTGAVLTRGTVDPYNEKVVRATMGALFHLPVVTGIQAQELACQMKEKVRVIVAHVGATRPYYDCDYCGRVAVVLGNENRGPSPEILKQAEAQVKIPLWGPVESLNVAVAAAILLYEAARRRYAGEV